MKIVEKDIVDMGSLQKISNNTIDLKKRSG
jgi:hypothetical protein